MSRSWLAVDRDETGTARVFVKEKHLSDFPKFMNDIICYNVGLDEGVFKINIVDRQGGTDINVILQLIKTHFTSLRSESKVTPSGNVKNVRSYPQVKKQSFKQSGAKDEQLYGYLDLLRTTADIKKDRQHFLNNVESPVTFLQESTSCLQMLSRSVDDLEDHYWREIATSAAGASSITYGAGIPIDEDKIKFSANFTLSKLGTILDVCPITYPGIQQPFLYVGEEFATFPWHIEDSALFSINVLHYGAPCLWNFVPPHLYKKFVSHIQFFPLDLAQVSCTNALGHKYIIASKKFLSKFGISVHTVIQKENDILVIFPFASHSGFKCGRNLQVAVNFADPWWVEPAILAPSCACFVTQIHLDLKEFIAVARHHLLHDYVNNNYAKLYKDLEGNEFVRKLGMLPSVFLGETVHALPDKNSTGDTCRFSVSSPNEQEMTAEAVATEKEPAPEPQFLGARCTIFCPLRPKCSKSFEGGRCKLPRMKAHIIKEHGGDPKLLGKLCTTYPPKHIGHTKGSDCDLCGQFISGHSYHMSRHMDKVHFK